MHPATKNRLRYLHKTSSFSSLPPLVQQELHRANYRALASVGRIALSLVSVDSAESKGMQIRAQGL